MKVNTKNQKGKSTKVFKRANDYAQIARAMKAKNLDLSYRQNSKDLSNE